MNFKNKEGYSPTPDGMASNITAGNSTTGAGTNCLITTNDIQCKLSELRTEIHRLKDRKELSPSDTLFSLPTMYNETMKDILLNSSTSATFVLIFKDTKTTIKKHDACIVEIE